MDESTLKECETCKHCYYDLGRTFNPECLLKHEETTPEHCCGNWKPTSDIEILPTRLLYYNSMKFFNENDGSGYGAYVFKHATQWASKMEKDIKYHNYNWNETVEYFRENATNLSFETECCKEGLSGFQQDCATMVLVNCWKYGYQLCLGLSLEFYDKGYSMPSKRLHRVILFLNKNYLNLKLDEDRIYSKNWW